MAMVETGMAFAFGSFSCHCDEEGYLDRIRANRRPYGVWKVLADHAAWDFRRSRSHRDLLADSRSVPAAALSLQRDRLLMPWPRNCCARVTLISMARRMGEVAKVWLEMTVGRTFLAPKPSFHLAMLVSILALT